MMKNPHPARRRVYMLLAFFGAFLLLFFAVLYSAQLSLTVFLIYASNEPKSAPARDLDACRDNLRNSQSVFLIVNACIRGKHGLYDNTWKIQCTDRYQ